MFIYPVLCYCHSEKAMTPHSSTLAWKIPWMEEPGRLQFMGLLRDRHDWATSLSIFTFLHWRRKWQPISSVLAWRIPGAGEPRGLPSMGLHRVGHDWSDLAAAAAVVLLVMVIRKKLKWPRWILTFCRQYFRAIVIKMCAVMTKSTFHLHTFEWVPL